MSFIPRVLLAVVFSISGCTEAGLPHVNLGVEQNCIPGGPETQAEVCEWALAPKAVVFGQVRALTPRHTPVYGPVDDGSGGTEHISVEDARRCPEGKLIAGMVLDIDVTHVVAGEASKGLISVNIGAAMLEKWTPCPEEVDGEFEWGCGYQSERISIGQNLGLALYDVDDGELTVSDSDLFVERDGGLRFQWRDQRCVVYGPPSEALENSDIESLVLQVQDCSRAEIEDSPGFTANLNRHHGYSASDQSGRGRGAKCAAKLLDER